MNNHDLQEDDELTDEQSSLVEALTRDQVSAIDAQLLSNCSQQWRKAAFVVGLAMSELTSLVGIPDLYYSRRIRKLVSEGALESQGDLKHIRYSEIRVPVSGT